MVPAGKSILRTTIAHTLLMQPSRSPSLFALALAAAAALMVPVDAQWFGAGMGVGMYGGGMYGGMYGNPGGIMLTGLGHGVIQGASTSGAIIRGPSGMIVAGPQSAGSIYF